jgi:site-specific DNA-methyltransferase (adenine-specific)
VTSAWYQDDRVWIGHADCRDVLAGLPDACVDAVVCDPPYELGFMGKAWDGGGIAYSVELWAQVLRVLKPGGHLLAFGGTRTYHRMACAVEDAGFEIRDSLVWLYGQGFPAGDQNVGKAIDKQAGVERTEYVGVRPGHEQFVGKDNIASLRDTGALSGKDGYTRPWMFDPEQVEAQHHTYAPATPEAKQWDGWHTRLKPAMEPIVLARKPFKGTVASCVLTHGTGALNIDGCRIESNGEHKVNRITTKRTTMAGDDRTPGASGMFHEGSSFTPTNHDGGRYPANVLLDETVEFEQARYFYCSKAGVKERPKVGGIAHATVKPLALMRWLVRLVAPQGATVLDPFAGSGTTVEAALLEGMRCLAVESEEQYLPLIKVRVKRQQPEPEEAAS